jgi:DNA-directed RNA polymerase III subunit RPC3
MANPFAGFVHTSTLASLPHDPPISLASNCIRDFFGATVQLVADALNARGGASTLGQLIATIASKSRSKFRTDERKEIIKVSQLQSTSSVGGPSTPSIRAALLVLIQHSTVLVKKSKVTTSAKTKTIYTYEFLIDRARLLPRYPRYVEYTKKALDETAAALIEELLVQGRMRTVDAIVATVEQLHLLKDAPRSDRYTYRQAVLESFRRLVGGGFIQQVQAIKDETEEAEFDEQTPPPAKKARIEEHSTDDPAVVSLLQSGPYKILPREAVWRVNLEMFHDSLRAVSLGWLVAERYGHKVQSSGSMVTAALKLAAHKRHAQQDTDFETQSNFSTESITRYLPKSVLQNLEKKPGGVFPNLHKALVELTKFTNPSVVEEMEVADGHPENAQFQVATRKLVQYLHDRIIHQVILDSHGEVAARICSILRHTGYLESDAIAESAMVPAKDTREVSRTLVVSNCPCRLPLFLLICFFG